MRSRAVTSPLHHGPGSPWPRWGGAFWGAHRDGEGGVVTVCMDVNKLPISQLKSWKLERPQGGRKSALGMLLNFGGPVKSDAIFCGIGGGFSIYYWRQCCRYTWWGNPTQQILTAHWECATKVKVM